MNDLAEKALHGADIARRQVRDHPAASFGAAGFVLAAVIVVAAGEVGTAGSTRPLTTWLGLQDAHNPPTNPLPAALALAAVVALVVLWAGLVRFTGRSPIGLGRAWALAAAWAAPFVIGPPLLDTTVYSAAAHGLLQRTGRDPYTTAPSALGDAHVVTAIDPGARGTPSASGPLGSVLEHLAVSVSHGSALGAVIVLRVLAVLAVVWIGRSATEFRSGSRDRALVLTVLNPLTLLYAVSAAHLDGLMIALVLAGLLAARRRRWRVAVAWVALAGCVAPQALVVLPVLVLAHLAARRTAARRTTGWWRVAGRDAVVAVVVVGALGAVVPNGFGWAWSTRLQFATHTPFSVAGAISAVLDPMVPGASYDDLEIGGRATVLIAMACALAYLIGTTTRRPLEWSAGYALLAVALLAPALNPWYLLWGALCLAVRASGRQLNAVVGLCAAGCVLNPIGFSHLTRNVLTAAALGAVAVAVVVAVAIAEAAARRSAANGADAVVT